MERIRNPAEIDIHYAVQLVEGFAGAVPPQPALNAGIRNHQLERRSAVGVIDPGAEGRRLCNIETSLAHLGAALAAEVGSAASRAASRPQSARWVCGAA